MIKIIRRRRLGNTSTREIVRNMETPSEVIRSWVEREFKTISPDDTVVRWGCTSNVPTKKVLNTSEAIHGTNNKSAFRKILHEKELCPLTAFTRDSVIRDLPTPVIVRPRFHAQGRKLFVVKNNNQLDEAIKKCGDGWYASVLLDKKAEYRVFVVQGRVACVARKTPGNPEDVAWNVARGGRFDNVRWEEWPLQAVRKSIEAFNLSKLDFGGVDVMVDHQGESNVIEINSAPSLTSPYRQECMAKCFDYIVEKEKDRIPLIPQRGGYRKFIHPAVCDQAQLP